MCVQSQSNKSRDCLYDVLDFIEQGLQENPVRTVSSVVRRISWQGDVRDCNAAMNLSPFQTEVRIGNGSLNYKEGCARYYSTLSECCFRGMRVRHASCYELYVHVFRSGENDTQELVLTPVRQLRKYGEQWGQYRVGTIERLKTEDGISYSIRDTGKSTSSRFLESFRGFGHDESRTVRLRWHGASGKMRDRIDEVVESIPEIGHAIANDERPSVNSRLGSELGTKVVLGHVLVAFVNNTVRVVIQPCRNFSIDGIEVTASPTHLCIYAL